MNSRDSDQHLVERLEILARKNQEAMDTRKFAQNQMRQGQQNPGGWNQNQGRFQNYVGNSYYGSNQNRNQSFRPKSFSFDRNSSNRNSNFQNSGWHSPNGEGRIVCLRCGKANHHQLSCKAAEKFCTPPQRRNSGIKVAVRPTFLVVPPRNTSAITYSTQDVRTCLPLGKKNIYRFDQTRISTTNDRQENERKNENHVVYSVVQNEFEDRSNVIKV